MSEQKEAERLRRLREQQLNARDPLHAHRKHGKIVSSRPRSHFSLGAELKSLPAKVTWAFWGAVWGFFMGLFFSAVIWLAFQINLTGWIVLGTMVFCALLGIYLGSVKDSGRENWR